jgi:hypothetical protein
MLDKEKLLQFLLKARTQTYAGAQGKVKSILNGSVQMEHKEGDWFYRDIYYIGNGIFTGLEVIHFKDKPIWSMCYYGNFKKMTEKEVDKILRGALMDKWQEARLWKKVEWEKDDFKYICEPDFEGSINEMAGMEKIFKSGDQVYTFFYAGGLIG